MLDPFLKTLPHMRMTGSSYLKEIKKSLQKKNQLLELNQ